MVDEIDWSIVTNNLRNRYKPLSVVAKEVGSDWRHIGKLSRGEVRQTKYDVAVRLLDLHYEHCPDRHKLELLVTHNANT